MNLKQVERWIFDINQGLRGSEYSAAMEKLTDEGLSRSAFIEIYINEVLSGKHWAVYNDFVRKGISLSPPKPLIIKFALDQVWYRSHQYECSGVVPPMSVEVQAKIESGDFVPNAWHPSDHFPLMVRFSPRQW